MYQLIRHQFDELVAQLPAHRTDLENGLLLALAGAVEPADVPDGANWLGHWKVTGQSVNGQGRETYTVLIGADRRWACNCPAHAFNGKPVEDLLGYDGVACKHIAAVALMMPHPQVPDKPGSVWELVERLVLAQWMPRPDGTIELPGTKARLKRVTRDGQDTVVIQTGRSRSKPLIRWAKNHQAISGGGQWQIVTGAKENYNGWVRKVTR